MERVGGYISMIDNTNNIYNTNISIIVSNDSINIYSLYITINKYIYNTKRELKKLTKELDIRVGGPNSVQAQTYDKPFVQSSMRIEDVKEIYKQISRISNKINELKEELNILMNSKKQMEEFIRLVAKENENNIETRVFIGHYIEKKSLKELSHEISRVNYKGSEQYYDYGYIRKIHMKIKDKIGKSNEKEQFEVEKEQ